MTPEAGRPTVSNYAQALEAYGQVVITGKGRSMLPLIRAERDMAIIETRPRDGEGRPLRCRKYDVVLYRRGNRYVLHRVLKVLPQGYVICGDNRWQPERDVNEAQIIGVATAFVRKGKEIPVTNVWYRVYVHLWCDFFPIRAGILWGKHVIGRLFHRAAKKQ